MERGEKRKLYNWVEEEEKMEPEAEKVERKRRKKREKFYKKDELREG